MDRNQGQEEPAGATNSTKTAAAGNSTEAASLAKLMELLIEDRHKREQDMAKEQVQWEQEVGLTSAVVVWMNPGCIDLQASHGVSLVNDNCRVKPTGDEGERVRTASHTQGRARPGLRTGVPCCRRQTGMNASLQSEGEHLTGGQDPTQSEVQSDGERWYSRTIMSNRGEGQVRVDSQHTGSCQEENSEPLEADRVNVRAGRSCAQASRKHSGGNQLSRVYRMATECTGWLLSGQACATKQEKEREVWWTNCYLCVEIGHVNVVVSP